MAYKVKLPPEDGGEKKDGSTISEKPVIPVIPVTDENYPDVSKPSKAFVGHSDTGNELVTTGNEVVTPVTDPERLADLDVEEAIFALYWRTLPDKALARRTWPSELRYYCLERDLGPEMLEALERRIRDLRKS